MFHALSADGRVSDASAISPDPCDVVVSVLSWETDGTAGADVLQAVRVKLSDEDIRPMGDRVTVQSSVIVPYAVRAVLHMKGQGPGRSVALQACLLYTSHQATPRGRSTTLRQSGGS